MRYCVVLLMLPLRGSRDPEGETLAAELRRLGHRFITGIVAGKALLVEVEAGSEEEARRLVLQVARDARLYNPVVQEAWVVRVAPGGCSQVPRD